MSLKSFILEARTRDSKLDLVVDIFLFIYPIIVFYLEIAFLLNIEDNYDEIYHNYFICLPGGSSKCTTWGHLKMYHPG